MFFNESGPASIGTMIAPVTLVMPPYRSPASLSDGTLRARVDWAGHAARLLPTLLGGWLIVIACETGRVARFGVVVLGAPLLLIGVSIWWMRRMALREPVALEVEGRHLHVRYRDGTSRSVHLDELRVTKVRDGVWSLDPEGHISIHPHHFGPNAQELLLGWLGKVAGRAIRLACPSNAKRPPQFSVHSESWDLRKPESRLPHEMAVALAAGVVCFVASARLVGFTFALALGTTATTGTWLFIWVRRPHRIEIGSLGITLVRGMWSTHARGRLVRARRENGRITMETAEGQRVVVRDDEFDDTLEWARFIGCIEQSLRRDIVINPIGKSLKRQARTNTILEAVRSDLAQGRPK